MTRALPSQAPISGPLTLGELLDRAFRLYRSRFRTFFVTAGIILLPWSLLNGVVTGSYTITMWRALRALAEDPESLATFQGVAGPNMSAGLFLSVAGWLLLLFVMLALTSQAIESLQGGSQSIGESLRVALRRFLPTLGMQILRWLALAALFFGLTILAFLAAALFGVVIGGIGSLVDGAGPLETVLIIGFFFLAICLGFAGLALLAIPVLYLFARWMVAMPGIVDQHWGAGESLRRSWQLTRGAALRCSGYLLLLWMLSLVIVALPVSVAQSILGLLVPTSALAFTVAAASVVSALLSMLWQPLFAIALVLLYFDLRVRREGYDITLRVEAMEAALRAEEAEAPNAESDDPQV